MNRIQKWSLVLVLDLWLWYLGAKLVCFVLNIVFPR